MVIHANIYLHTFGIHLKKSWERQWALSLPHVTYFAFALTGKLYTESLGRNIDPLMPTLLISARKRPKDTWHDMKWHKVTWISWYMAW
jgi:hypothetical protein